MHFCSVQSFFNSLKMDTFNFKIITTNAHRIGRKIKVIELKERILNLSPHIVYIQEISVKMAIEVFSSYFQVLVNMEDRAHFTDGIGMVTLVKNGIKIVDFILGEEGRTIGLKINDAQFWNVYPKSGTENKKWRETYFRETLPNYMVNWKDHTSFVNQGGDHNATIRLIDSENNQGQHLQEGLIKQLQIFGLKDEYVRLHGNDNPVSFSRITRNSKTRIDIIASNVNKCTEFYYMDAGIGFDHKMGVATYDLDILIEKETIPKHLFVPGWAFPKELQNDDAFFTDAKIICDTIENDVNCEEVISDEPINFTHYWMELKKKLVCSAKQREREIKKLENARKNYLNLLVQKYIGRIEQGVNCWEEFEKVRKELNEIWHKKAVRSIQRLKCIEVEDHVYDIHKIQKQKKYANKARIRKLNIDGVLFTGTEEVVAGLENKVKHDLEPGNDNDWDDEPSQEELFFLDRLPQLQLSVDELEEIHAPVGEKECEYIINNQVQLDSAPGMDGVTYRMISCLWNFPSFKYIFVNAMDWTRKNASVGNFENVGMMKFINKKRQTEEYTGKRKLTLVNKDINFAGKLWTNRFRKYVLDKVLPKTQFNCQNDLNIVDENRELRNITLHLRGDHDGHEQDGTLVSIDMKDAFRSTFHRWFKLIMIHMQVPTEIRDWFWALYSNLSLVIVVNKMKSGKIKVSRGFCEGNPPSMPGFVACMIPLLSVIEDSLEGIKTIDGKLHKVKAFADDAKVVLKEPQEIHMVYSLIERFERVSGLEMHRDPIREKCQALVFGSHRLYQNWPDWITLKNVIKILGVLYTNDPLLTLELVNGNKVKEIVLEMLHAAYGMRGTVLQKIYYVNTFILSKIWYVCQTIMLDKKMLMEIDKLMRKFIFAGQNERPVQAVCYREKEDGGLGLVCPITKCRALLVKNMIKDYQQFNFDDENAGRIYGNLADLDKILNVKETGPWTTKEIYSIFLEEKIFSGESLIPTRAEKRSRGIKWSTVWSNQVLLKKLTAEEKFFAWQLPQDMLPVGSRLHRPDQSKLCQMKVADANSGNTRRCSEIENIRHAMYDCSLSKARFEILLNVLPNMLSKNVTAEEILYLSFNHRNKKILTTALWFATKVMFLIYSNRTQTLGRMLDDLYKELFWHQKLDRGVGHVETFSELLNKIRNIKDSLP